MIRKLAAWLYAFGIVAAAGGAIVYLSNIPDIPREDSLEWKRGYVIGIRLDYDLDGLAIVNLKFRGEEKPYKYLSIYPKYVEVRDRLGIYREIEVLVQRDAQTAKGDSVKVWGLIEHDPFGEGTVVTFEEIRAEVTETERSWQGAAIIFLAGGIGSIGIGYVTRRMVPYVPKDPTA